MLGIEVISKEIESPFGMDANDLPTRQLAITIGENISEIMSAVMHKDYSLETLAMKEVYILHTLS